MQIIPATEDHFAAILALNEEFVHVLAPLSRDRLDLLHSRASYHRVAVEDRAFQRGGADQGAVDQGAIAGFLLAFGSDVPHDSVNFHWFAEWYDSFLYVDRVVVAAHCQGVGVGGLLYRDLFDFARDRGYERVACEIDADPPNPRSEQFHHGLGFREVGSQQVEYVSGKPKRVSMRSVSIAGD